MPAPVATDLLDPFWEEFTLQARGGLIYAQYNAPVATIDVTQFVETYTLTESLRDIARTLDFTLDTAELPEPWRCGLGSDIQLFGHSFGRTSGVVAWQSQFTGKIYLRNRHEAGGVSKRSFRAYDFLTSLARTEDILVYTNNTMTQIVVDICNRYGIPMGIVVDTEVPVGQIIQGTGTSAAAMIEEASQRTLRRANRKYFVRVTEDNTALELLELGHTGVEWDLGDGASGVLETFDAEESAEQTRTAIRLITEETAEELRYGVIGHRKNEVDPLYLTFGKLAANISPDNTTNAPTNDEQLDAEYRARNRTVERANTNNLILPGARQGDKVTLHLPDTSTVTAYINTVQTEHRAGHSMQSLELVYDSLGTAA